MNNTRELSVIIIFVALTIALNVVGPKFPAPYAPFLFYEIWEIPIVIAFIVLGPKVGISIAVLNTAILLVAFNPGLPTGPIYNLIAILPMLLGVYIPYRIATHGCKVEDLGSFLRQHVKLISIAATAPGIILRVAVTSTVNYFALPQPYPIGFSLNLPTTIGYLSLIALFNTTVTLYTIPIALAIAIAVVSRFKL